jgi:hypothetical protein
MVIELESIKLELSELILGILAVFVNFSVSTHLCRVSY